MTNDCVWASEFREMRDPSIDFAREKKELFANSR